MMKETRNIKTATKPFRKWIAILAVVLFLVLGTIGPSEAFASSIQGACSTDSGMIKAGLTDSAHTGVDIGNKKSSGGSSKRSSSKKSSSSSSSSKNKNTNSSSANAAKSYAYLSAMRYLNKEFTEEDGSSADEEGPLFSGNPPAVFDGAGVLDESAIADLEESCAQISDEMGYGVYIALFNGLETDDFTTFTREYFEGEGYGLGDLNGGMLLVVDLANEGSIGYRSNISSSVINDLWSNEMLRDVGYRFGTEDYFGACEQYVSMIEQAFLYYNEEHSSLKPIDSVQYVNDECGFLSGAEYEDLSSRCKKISEQTDTPIFIVSVETIGSEDPEDFLQRFVQEHGLGFGEDYRGVYAMFVKDTSDVCIKYRGETSQYFTDEEINNITEACKSVNFNELPEAFVKACEDGVARYEEAFNRATNRDLMISFFVLLAIVAVFVTRRILKKSHKPKRQEWNIPDYEREGSFILTESNDYFCGEKNVKY
ncbi:MAG: TPM domain-containing protein [Eggerthellaceae bacterium]